MVIHIPDGLGPRPESFMAQLRFANGSIGQICYTSLGDTAMGKERVEVFAGGASGIIDDFNSGLLFKSGRKTKLKGRGKGHQEEVLRLLDAVKTGNPSPIPLQTLLGVTRATFEVRRPR